MTHYKDLGLVEHPRHVQEGHGREVRHPRLQLQQHGAAAGHHPGLHQQPLARDPADLQGRAQVREPDPAPLHGPGRHGDHQGIGCSDPGRPASRPRRQLRAVRLVHRERLLVGHDRRLGPPLRQERRADEEGRRVRPHARRHRRGRARRAGRHRGRGLARGLALHRPERRRGLREEDRRRQPGHLDRHLPRRLQVQGEAGREASRRSVSTSSRRSSDGSPASPSSCTAPRRWCRSTSR